MKKFMCLLYAFALLSVLLGSQARNCELESYDPDEEIVSSEAAVTPEYVFYQKTFRAVTDKTLRDEDFIYFSANSGYHRTVLRSKTDAMRSERT